MSPVRRTGSLRLALVLAAGLTALAAGQEQQTAGQEQQTATPPAAEEPQAGDIAQRPLFRAGARFVRVDVFPTGKDGRPVEGLTAGDFEVYEDGERQTIDTFEFVDIEPDLEEARVDPNTQAEGDAWARDPRARLFVIVLDTKHVGVTGGARVRRPLIDMLDRLIGPRDVFGVITPQLRPSDLMLGRKTITAADMLMRHWAWGTAGTPIRDGIQDFFEGCYGFVSSSPLARELVARSRERETLTHLQGLVARLGGIRDEKKTVIVVTQGWTQFGRNDGAAYNLGAPVPGIYTGGGRISTRDTQAAPGQADRAECARAASELLSHDNSRDFRELYAEAQRANVSFYPVDPRGLAVYDTPISEMRGSILDDFQGLRTRRDSLQEIAINTDGRALMHSNDIGAELRKLAESLSTYYLLGYYSGNTNFDGRFRKIDVKVRKPDIKLKARRGYYAPSTEAMEAMAAAREAAAAPVPAEVAELSDALGRLDAVRHDRDLYVQAARVPGALIVSAELGVNARSAAAWSSGGEIRLLVSAGTGQAVDTKPIPPMRPGVVVRVPIEGEGGDVRIDARARATGTGPLSAADASVTLPPAPASLIGDVLSYRGLARARMPAADGRYRRTERATIEAVLAGDAVPAGARLLDRAGKPLPVPVTSRLRVDADGARWMTAELALAPLTDGDYVFELEVTRDAERERKLFAIKVVR